MKERRLYIFSTISFSFLSFFFFFIERWCDSNEKERKLVICYNIDGSYVRRKKTNTFYHLYVESKALELVETETEMVLTRSGWWGEELGS